MDGWRFPDQPQIHAEIICASLSLITATRGVPLDPRVFTLDPFFTRGVPLDLRDLVP